MVQSHFFLVLTPSLQLHQEDLLSLSPDLDRRFLSLSSLFDFRYRHLFSVFERSLLWLEIYAYANCFQLNQL